MLGIACGLGPAACVADPMVPCGAFDAGEAPEGRMVQAFKGPIAAFAMRDVEGVADREAFVLRNLCDGDECRLDRLTLPDLSAGSQVMLTTEGHFLVGIDREDGGIWTYEFDEDGHQRSREQTYVDENDGPAKLVIGLRQSDSLIVRDRQGRLSVYEPEGYKAIPIAPELGDYARLAAVGHRHVAIKVPHAEGKQSLYLVDLGAPPERGRVRDPARPIEIATGDLTSIVIGQGDGTLVVSEGRGTEATVLVFDIPSQTLVDAFEGSVVSARQENQRRALEELPGLHAVSPSGEHVAYRTTSGALAVRHLDSQSSCLVRNTNRLGTSNEPSRKVGDHATAGFSNDGIIYAEYNVGRSDSYVYAYEPRQQQIVSIGTEDGGWHLSAVPGRVTAPDGEIEQLWAVGVREGTHVSIGEGGVDGETIGRQLTYVPRADDAIWAVDTSDQVVVSGRSERALSVRRVAPPRWSDGRLRFEQGPEQQVVEFFEHVGTEDIQGPLRVPLEGQMCLSTGAPGTWAYRCGDSNHGRYALTTNSGSQEQSDDPNSRPEFDPPFPEDDDPSDDEE